MVLSWGLPKAVALRKPVWFLWPTTHFLGRAIPWKRLQQSVRQRSEGAGADVAVELMTGSWSAALW